MTTLKEAYNEIIASNLNEPEERETYLQDLTQHGAISGMVGGLIYYHETTQFFNEHRDEILSMLDQTKKGYLVKSGTTGRTYWKKKRTTQTHWKTKTTRTYWHGLRWKNQQDENSTNQKKHNKEREGGGFSLSYK